MSIGVGGIPAAGGGIVVSSLNGWQLGLLLSAILCVALVSITGGMFAVGAIRNRRERRIAARQVIRGLG